MSLAGTRAGRRESLDLTGAVTGTAGLAALIYGVMQSADHGWTSGLVVGPAVAGLLLLVVFTVVEARFAAQPMLPLRLFRIRGVAVGNAMLLLFGGIAIAMWYFTSLFLQNVLGYSALRAGLGQTPAAVMFVVVARWAAALLPRTGVRPLVLAGCGCLRGRFRLARPGRCRQRTAGRKERKKQGAPADGRGTPRRVLAVARSDGALLQLAALPLGETTPDPEALVIHQCGLQALVTHLTRQADLLGLPRGPTLLRKERLGSVCAHSARSCQPTSSASGSIKKSSLIAHRPFRPHVFSTLLRLPLDDSLNKRTTLWELHACRNPKVKR